MKKIIIALLLCLLSFHFSSAAVDSNIPKPDLPLTIGDYLLAENETQYEPNFCSEDYWGKYCRVYWRAEYKGPNNLSAFVYLTNINTGLNVYTKNVTKIGSQINIDGYEAFKNAYNFVSWIPKKKAKVSKYSFNIVQVTVGQLVTYGDSTQFEYTNTVPEENPVTKYFMKKHPSIKYSLRTQNSLPPSIVANPKIEILNPKLNEVVRANDVYEIKWNSSNIPDNVNIKFRLLYNNVVEGTRPQMWGPTIGEAKNSLGNFRWKVSDKYVYGKREDAENSVYTLEAYLANANGQIYYQTATPKFKIIGKSKSIPKMVFLHTLAKTYTQGQQVTAAWEYKPFGNINRLFLVDEKTKKATLLYDNWTKSDPSSGMYSWIIDPNTKPGKYHLEINAITNNQLVGSGKSPSFKVI